MSLPRIRLPVISSVGAPDETMIPARLSWRSLPRIVMDPDSAPPYVSMAYRPPEYKSELASAGRSSTQMSLPSMSAVLPPSTSTPFSYGHPWMTLSRMTMSAPVSHATMQV
jgi:hypothetical protein